MAGNPQTLPAELEGRMMLTLLHASDLHFGKHFDPEASEALLRFADALSPDVVVLSGDFTQRAKVREFEAAREYLARLSSFPVVVTPGNHDVPLYRIAERAFTPHRNYQEFVSGELNTLTRVPGATVVALDSSAPRSAIVNGRLSDAQLRFAAGAFQEAGPDEIRILVTHHNLARAPDYGPEQVLPAYRRYLEAFSRMGVELILGGHLHRAYVASSLDVYPQEPGARSLTLVHSGTTTSRRGRARERGVNSLNVLRIAPETLEITIHRLSKGSGNFEQAGSCTVPRERNGRP